MIPILNKKPTSKKEANLIVLNEKKAFSYYQHNRLVVSIGHCKAIIPFMEIAFIKSDGNYCEVHTVDKKKFLVSRTLKDIAQQVNELFYRSHQSYIVNLLNVEQYDMQARMLTTTSKVRIPVARSRKASLSKLIK